MYCFMEYISPLEPFFVTCIYYLMMYTTTLISVLLDYDTQNLANVLYFCDRP